MTVIITHGRSGSRTSPPSVNWLSRLVEFAYGLRDSWRRRQMQRALEALPADTLKDIGWPTTDNKRMRIVRK